ncbi:MAG: asparagine synthase (glutamine-hydrolyzing) [Candidatus Magasanikbacteria bacterium]|nr:asparagine synthase (glutamine-hydrolyzing) [Candidatus Magasanikbacteria bacterium]
MCGIFGVIGKIDEEQARNCLDTLSHRGPDGYGIWTEKEVFLGHRRLAILDLSERGKQPMSFGNGRYWITLNGEIYNFIEIREELKARGHTFISDSDTEVVLAAYTEWGEKCLHKFNGMWAFAIWDRHKEEMFISRDRFGKKPLFYAYINGNFVFASEMKAITPLLDTVEPNYEILNNNARIFYYESTDACLIKNIKRFPAGHCAIYKNGNLEIKRYWNTLDNLAEVPEKYEDQVEQFRGLFLDACKIRMRSDVPIGTALSGGLDSSAVFSAVAHIGKNVSDERKPANWQNAFSAAFPGTPIDETMFARKVAQNVGVELSSVTIDPQKYVDKLFDYLYLFEDIYITSPIPFIAVYKAMRDNGVVVTLDGHAADELFGGYSFDFLHILHDEMFSFRNSKAVIDTYYDSYINDGVQFKKLPPKFIFWAKEFSRNLVKKAIGYHNHNADENHPEWKRMDYFTQKLYISSHQTVLPTLLRNYDRYSMINGVEIRMPFMDYRIVSFAFSLPWTSKIRNGYTKSVIRDATAAFMPRDIAYRKTKVGFNSPTVDWMRGPLKHFFMETIHDRNFLNSKFIDPKDVSSKITNVINDPRTTFSAAEAAWQSINPYFWEQSFLKRVASPKK